jgi:predicted TIM-barrel fold metal-dependent hydrolase
LKFPALKIVCGHIGHPWTAEMIAVAWKHQNVFIDTSAHLPKYYPPVSTLCYGLLSSRFPLLTILIQELIQFANTTGRKKVMFGTNFPQLSWDACVRSVNKDTTLREEVKVDFFGGNIARLLKIDSRLKL